MNKMTKLPLHSHFSGASQLVYGCMGLGGGWNSNPITREDVQQTVEIIDVALENSINVFDHADIYTFGKAEQVFGEAIKQNPSVRAQMFIQSKCGIRFADAKGPKRYDFSSDWIKHSVDKSLKHLNIDYLDMLLLHRPDPLMALEETAEALNTLVQTGKIRSVGVSNMHKGQIKLLQSALDGPIIANQIEMSLAHFDWLDSGITTGSPAARMNGFDSGLLEFSQLQDIQLQAWGSLAQGKVTHCGKNADKQQRGLVDQVNTLAASYETTPEAIALAWLTRLPMGIQPIIGTTNVSRIKACSKAQSVSLSREHWYQLYEVARGNEMP